MRLTRFDLNLGMRTLGFSAVFLALSAAIAIATDEPFSTTGMRVARLCAFAPALAALGAGVALAQSTGRGEIRALAALGLTPWAAARGAAISTALIGVVALSLLLSPSADPSSLFPTIHPAAWQRVGDGLIEAKSGVYVSPMGQLSFATLRPALELEFRPSQLVASMAVAPLALAVPFWITTPSRLAPRLAIGAVTVLLTVFLLHSVGAQQSPGWLLLATALPLTLQTAILRVRQER